MGALPGGIHFGPGSGYGEGQGEGEGWVQDAVQSPCACRAVKGLPGEGEGCPNQKYWPLLRGSPSSMEEALLCSIVSVQWGSL